MTYLKALEDAFDAIQAAYDECPNLDAYKLDIAQLEKALSDVTRMHNEQAAIERRANEEA